MAPPRRSAVFLSRRITAFCLTALCGLLVAQLVGHSFLASPQDIMSGRSGAMRDIDSGRSPRGTHPARIIFHVGTIPVSSKWASMVMSGQEKNLLIELVEAYNVQSESHALVLSSRVARACGNDTIVTIAAIAATISVRLLVWQRHRDVTPNNSRHATMMSSAHQDTDFASCAAALIVDLVSAVAKTSDYRPYERGESSGIDTASVMEQDVLLSLGVAPSSPDGSLEFGQVGHEVVILTHDTTGALVIPRVHPMLAPDIHPATIVSLTTRPTAATWQAIRPAFVGDSAADAVVITGPSVLFDAITDAADRCSASEDLSSFATYEARGALLSLETEWIHASELLVGSHSPLDKAGSMLAAKARARALIFSENSLVCSKVTSSGDSDASTGLKSCTCSSSGVLPSTPDSKSDRARQPVVLVHALSTPYNATLELVIDLCDVGAAVLLESARPDWDAPSQEERNHKSGSTVQPSMHISQSFQYAAAETALIDDVTRVAIEISRVRPHCILTVAAAGVRTMPAADFVVVFDGPSSSGRELSATFAANSARVASALAAGTVPILLSRRTAVDIEASTTNRIESQHRPLLHLRPGLLVRPWRHGMTWQATTDWTGFVIESPQTNPTRSHQQMCTRVSTPRHFARSSHLQQQIYFEARAVLLSDAITAWCDAGGGDSESRRILEMRASVSAWGLVAAHPMRSRADGCGQSGRSYAERPAQLNATDAITAAVNFRSGRLIKELRSRITPTSKCQSPDGRAQERSCSDSGAAHVSLGTRGQPVKGAWSANLVRLPVCEAAAEESSGTEDALLHAEDLPCIETSRYGGDGFHGTFRGVVAGANSTASAGWISSHPSSASRRLFRLRSSTRSYAVYDATLHSAIVPQHIPRGVVLVLELTEQEQTAWAAHEIRVPWRSQFLECCPACCGFEGSAVTNPTGTQVEQWNDHIQQFAAAEALRRAASHARCPLRILFSAWVRINNATRPANVHTSATEPRDCVPAYSVGLLIVFADGSQQRETMDVPVRFYDGVEGGSADVVERWKLHDITLRVRLPIEAITVVVSAAGFVGSVELEGPSVRLHSRSTPSSFDVPSKE